MEKAVKKHRPQVNANEKNLNRAGKVYLWTISNLF